MPTDPHARLTKGARRGRCSTHALRGTPLGAQRHARLARSPAPLQRAAAAGPDPRPARRPRRAGVISSVGVHTESAWGFTPVEGYDKNVTYSSGRCPARAYLDRLLGSVQARPRAALPGKRASYATLCCLPRWHVAACAGLRMRCCCARWWLHAPVSAGVSAGASARTWSVLTRAQCVWSCATRIALLQCSRVALPEYRSTCECARLGGSLHANTAPGSAPAVTADAPSGLACTSAAMQAEPGARLGPQACPADVTRVFTHRIALADDTGVRAAYDMFERRLDGCIKVALLPHGSAA